MQFFFSLFQMSGDIRSSDSEDVTESSESHALNNGNLTGTSSINDVKKKNTLTKNN